jgi:photosystem II stability/assembly factor-like uncharacterized protein
MKHRAFLFLPIVSIIFFNVIYLQSGWFQQVSGTGLNLNCVYFIDANTGFIGADEGRILKTTNGGANWTIYNTGINRIIYSIKFPSGSSIGFAGTTDKTLRTSNGGLSWDTTILRGGKYISFININTGYALNGYKHPGIYLVYKTSNSGLTWDSISVALSGPGGMNKIFFINENTGYAAGNTWSIFMSVYTPFIIKTTNSGINWSMSYSGQASPIIYSTVSDIFFIGDTGFGLGFNGTGSTPYLYKTTNAGTNWALIQLPQIMASVKFINVNTGWLCGTGGRILYSSNGGSNWYDQVSGISNALNEIFMLDQNTGFIVGSGGKILSTLNGGTTGLIPVNNVIPKAFSLHQNYPNPFNPATNIKFDIPKSSYTRLSVYDALGRELEMLVNENLQPGTYEINFDAHSIPSGVYYYALRSGSFSDTRKMVLVK